MRDVWVNFIDYFHPEAEAFWDKMLQYINDKVPISGFWLDANEITSFYPNGYWGHQREHRIASYGRKYYYLPFYPGAVNFYELQVVDIDSIHYNGYEEYNMRSFNSLMQSKYTFNHLKKRSEFPFMPSRGTMFGAGQFVSHFIPDIVSDWQSMRVSFGSILSFGLFGIPMVGTDICGMSGMEQTPAELCARWHQLALFYPFTRNHHTPDDTSQLPGTL